MTMVEVTHKCGRVLGTFGAADDNCCIAVHCPKCKVLILLHNAIFCELEEDFEKDEKQHDHTKPIETNGCFHRVVDVDVEKGVK